MLSLPVGKGFSFKMAWHLSCADSFLVLHCGLLKMSHFFCIWNQGVAVALLERDALWEPMSLSHGISSNDSREEVLLPNMEIFLEVSWAHRKNRKNITENPVRIWLSSVRNPSSCGTRCPSLSSFFSLALCLHRWQGKDDRNHTRRVPS